jgi:hypothetical protein
MPTFSRPTDVFDAFIVVGSILVILLVGVLIGIGLSLYVTRTPKHEEVHIFEMHGPISNRLRTQLPPNDPAWNYERI